MQNNFWLALPKGFKTLAPMEDVTDTVFREVVMSVAGHNKLHAVFTEFTSTDGLCDERGFAKVAQRLIVNESELAVLKEKNIKLVAQIWGNDPEKFNQSAAYLNKLNIFDGIDINMGCPVKKVVKKNTCSALIQFPDLAKEIIAATKEGCDIPVSVKTRIGFKKVVTEEWVSHLLDANPAAITIHGRLQKQQSEGNANWDEIATAVKVRNQSGKRIPILGNGDISDPLTMDNYTQEYHTDGLMIGRGIFKHVDFFHDRGLELNEKKELLEKHLKLFRDTWGNTKNYNILKRFYKIYIQGFSGASELRNQLFKTNNYADALEILAKTEIIQPDLMV